MKFFDEKNNRLVYISQGATPDFWDNLWDDRELKKSIEKGKNDCFVSRITKKFIKPGKNKKILEGGCGKGQFVYNLNLQGYDAYGIDFAANTIKKINELFPGLKITFGNIEKLDFPDNFFDGYWSLGVIEHFYDGYAKIINEMQRIIRNDGYLFLTFPYLSPFRKIKAKLGKYEKFDEKNFVKKNFYQFALDYKKVKITLENLGFKTVYEKPFDGIKGLKDEISFFKPVLQKIYDSNNIFLRFGSGILSKIFSPLTSHSMLIVLKKVYD